MFANPGLGYYQRLSHWQERSMPHISVTAAAHPDKPAYIMGNSGEVVTYRQLDERSNQLAHYLRRRGVG